MKRQYSNKRSWPHKGWLAALFAASGLLFGACNDDPASGAQGGPLPAGDYPLALTAAVVPASSAAPAAADDAWTGGEQVAVEAIAGDAPAAVKTYTAAADGRLSATDPLWWSSTDEQKTLRAWYCGDGSSAAGGANAATVPTAWSTASDQSGAEGYPASELLFAPAVTATFGSAAVPLRFYHQTAKVVVYIKNAEYVTDAAQIRSVRIGVENLALSGSYEAPDAGATAGVWTPVAADAGIIPRRLTTVPAGYVAAYEALVIPQSMDSKRLVAVETAAGTMYYTPAAGDAQLGAGKVHTYIITVRADRLDVEVVRGGEWNDGGSEGVESKELKIVYSAAELKLGDYYYSDGTTSDGGLRGIYVDGSLRMAAVKPAPEANKTVIGIVFQTDLARIGDAEKKALKEKGVDMPRGLVMALKNASNLTPWGPADCDEELPNCVSKEDAKKDIYGYGHSELIRQIYGSFDNNFAFKYADDYNKTCPAPETTTGWYLPASGQLYDMLHNLGGLADWDAATDDDNDFSWGNQGDVPAALNKWMEAVAPTAKNDFSSDDSFWSSSEYSDGYARCWRIRSNGKVDCYWNHKGGGYAVRPVLAF